MILKCAIIDDEPLAADLLAAYAKKTPDLHLVGAFNNAVSAMSILRNQPVDLVFLDIQMPDLGGLELVTLLPPHTRVVFTTAFDRYAVEAYRVNALDYLLKPISYEDFLRVVTKAQDWFTLYYKSIALATDRFLFIKSDYKVQRVAFDDILYIEGVKDYVKFYVSDERNTILSLMNMKKIEDTLPHPYFFRVHRSFIVNTTKITSVDRGRLVVNGVFIPVSDSYRDSMQSYIDEHTLH